MTSPVRAGVYERVSNARDELATSIAEQNDDNRRACAAGGWAIVRTFQDPNRSASRFATRGRPAYQAMLTAVEAGELDVLVLWEPSRGGRELESWAGFLNACREHRVKIHVTSHGRTYDLSNSRDWRSLAEDGVDSAYESEKTSLRTLRSRAASAAKGRPHGLPPFGYRRSYDPETGKMTGQVPDPAAAPVVAEIITRVAGSEPISALLRDLNARPEQPSPRGGNWTRAEIRWMCLNVTYIGKRRHNGGDLLDGSWAALVDAETFWAGVALLTAPGRKVTRPGRARWLLSLVAECGKCHGPAVARLVRGRQVYVCRDKGCFVAPLADVDEWVIRLVVGRLSRRGTYRKLAASDDRTVLAARAEAAGLRAQLHGFQQQAIAGAVTADSFAVIEAGLRTRIEAAQDAERAASVPPVLRSLLAQRDDIAARWKAMSIPQRKDVLRVLFSEIAIAPSAGRGPFDTDRITVTWAR